MVFFVHRVMSGYCDIVCAAVLANMPDRGCQHDRFDSEFQSMKESMRKCGQSL